MLRLRSVFDSRLGRCRGVGQRAYLRRTLPAEWRVLLAGPRQGDRPGGERDSRGGEGGHGEDAEVVSAGAVGAGWDVDFTEAQALWQDPMRVEIPARTVDEPRWLVIGQLDGKHW